jgi:hypothetical protein
MQSNKYDLPSTKQANTIKKRASSSIDKEARYN